MSKKGLIIAFAAIVLVAVGVAGYFMINRASISPSAPLVTPVTSSEDMKDWKTYQNANGFSFKYPPLLAQTSTSYYDNLYYCEQSNPYRCITNGWNIRIVVKDELFNREEIDKYFDSRQTEIDKLTINGKDFYIASNTAMSVEEWLVHTSLGDKTLQISFGGNAFIENANEEVNQRGLQRINQILSTVKFE